ncbi:hydroxymethylglutaryl-CoA lyase [Microlunatus sp. Y2014]|uniref:hydroxymethylglutaryl-CoA lyase n=1 Tax=Microlunatus sp. Y2014 TaxID=3418488 RepID=UPI003DA6D056
MSSAPEQAGTTVSVGPRPTPYERADLPTQVRIVEVGPRDGLQAERTPVATDAKLALIARLADAGLDTIEATSFVRPDRVPQLADAAEVMAGLDLGRGRRPVLVPNLTGYERARAVGAREVAVFVSATESFARANLGTDRDRALAMAGEVVERATADQVPVRGYVSMCFGDPWEGAVAPGVVAEVAAALVRYGCGSVSLGDTIGVGTAGQVPVVVTACVAAGVEPAAIALHFHDTYGQALANVLAGLEAGITEFDSAAGGLGGCPFARSATGNLATEDLVWLLEGLGHGTGIDLDALARTSAWLAGVLGRPMPSAVARALTT